MRTNQGVSATPKPFVLSHTGPCLERIPESIFHEILSYLPAFKDRHVFGSVEPPHAAIPSQYLIRSRTLRALSRTSRILRSRCLPMAWQRIELCAVRLPADRTVFYKMVGEVTIQNARVLSYCPHLLPLIQTVYVCLTRYKSAEVISKFAKCLATLPNLTTIHVVHAHRQMTTAIKNGFEGKQFPSVQRISLPSSAHEIIKCCPNLQEVTCIRGNGSTIIGSLVKTNLHKLSVVKGITAPFTRLAKKFHYKLGHISVGLKDYDTTPFYEFRFLHTIEIEVHLKTRHPPLSEKLNSRIQDARQLLKWNDSAAVKTVIVTRWWSFSSPLAYMTREVIKV